MEIGTQIGPYRIDGLLGKGGMAEVYKAWHTGLHRYEAMKVLPPQMTFDKSFVERFLNEARTAAGLHHPHMAVIHSVSEADCPHPYFTMELVEGGDLSDYLEARGALPLAEARPIFEQIAAALDYAHGRGLIHRDVKPANVLLKPEGENRHSVKLVDFGIARAQEEAGGTRLTKTGMIVGTPEYMSPEQGGSGAPVSHRTDIYALGVIAYETLCDHPPFKAAGDTSALSVIMQHVRDEPRPPLELVPTLPKAANAAILKALAKDPEQRFASCGEFVQALFSSTPVVIPKSQNAPKKSSPLMPMLAGAALFAGVGLVAMGVMQSGKSTLDGNAAAPPAAPTQQPEEATPKPAPVSVTVPDLVGKTEKQAREIIKAKSLTADVTTGYSDGFEAEKVMSQYPAVGSSVAKGAPVKIRISMGPKEKPVPAAIAEAPAPSSQPVAVIGSDIAEIKGRYNDWLCAWQGMDIDSYMAYYSPDVKQKRPNRPAHGYSTMRRRMTEYWSKLSYITIRSSEPEASFEGDRVVLTAVQDYDSTTWWDSGVKRTAWRREGGEWKIVEESFRKRAGGPK